MLVVSFLFSSTSHEALFPTQGAESQAQIVPSRTTEASPWALILWGSSQGLKIKFWNLKWVLYGQMGVHLALWVGL